MTRPLAAWRTTYSPGQWLALTGPNTLVLLPPPPARAAAPVEDLWLSVVQAGSLDALLRLVAETGLDELPDLGAFHWDDNGLHGIARGRVQVVDTDTDETVLQGEGAITWREEHLGRERHLGITLEDVEDDAPQLPLVVGAATVSALFLSTDPAALVRFPTVPDVEFDEPQPSLAQTPDDWHQAEFDHAVPAPGEENFDEPFGTLGEIDQSFDEPVPEAEADDAFAPAEPEVEVDDAFVAVEPEVEADDAFVAVEPEAAADEIEVAPSDEPVSPSSPGAERSDPIVIPPSLGEVDDERGTVFSAGLAATHKPASPAEDRDAQVLAAPCTNGHANAPGSRTCRICQYPVDSANPRLIRRPVLAGVHTNHGDFADVVTGVIVGRAPDPGKGPAGSHLMRVVSPGNDISRNHVLITTRDWGVHVTDLNSTNGTTVLPEGEPPFTLRDGASVEVGIGTVLDLGDGVSLRIEPPRG